MTDSATRPRTRNGSRQSARRRTSQGNARERGTSRVHHRGSSHHAAPVNRLMVVRIGHA